MSGTQMRERTVVAAPRSLFGVAVGRRVLVRDWTRPSGAGARSRGIREWDGRKPVLRVERLGVLVYFRHRRRGLRGSAPTATRAG